MKISCKENYLFVEPSSEITKSNYDEIKKTIDVSYQMEGMKNIVFDFKNTDEVTDDTMKLMLGRFKKVSENDGKIFIAGANRRVERALKENDMYRIFLPYNE